MKLNKLLLAILVGALLAVGAILFFYLSQSSDQLSVVGDLSCDRKVVCASEETCALSCSDFEDDGSFTCSVDEIDGYFNFDGSIYVACAVEQDVERCIIGFDGNEYCYTVSETFDLPVETIDFMIRSSACDPLNYHFCDEYYAEWGGAVSNPKIRGLGIPSAVLDKVYFDSSYDWPYSCDGDHAYLYDTDTVPFCSMGGCSNAITELPLSGTIHLDDFDPIKPKIVCQETGRSNGNYVWAWQSRYWTANYYATTFECNFNADCAESEKCVFASSGISSTCDALECSFTDVIVDHKCVNAELPLVCSQIGISDIFDCRDYVIEFVDILTEDVNGQIELITELTSQRDEQLEIISELELTVGEYSAMIDAFELTVQDQAFYINELNLTVSEQSTFIDELEISVSEQSALIDALQSTVNDQVDIISDLNLNIVEQAEYIADLNLTVQDQVQIINALQQNIEDKLILVGLLVAENDFQADLINQMGLSLENQASIIDSLNLEVEDDASLINDLNLNINDQAEIITFLQITTQEKLDLIIDLELSLEEQGELIGELSLNIQEQQFIINGLSSNVEEQAAIIASMSVSADEQDELISSLSDNLADSEALIDELESLRERDRLNNVLVVVGAFVGGLVISLVFYRLFKLKGKRVKRGKRK